MRSEWYHRMVSGTIMNNGTSFGRRDFFKGACVAGFMVAAAELPAVAEGERPKFEVGKRGAHSRLATSYAVVDIGLEKLLKAILSGHEHMTMEERFSPTAVQYLVGGNFLFAARELLFV